MRAFKCLRCGGVSFDIRISRSYGLGPWKWTILAFEKSGQNISHLLVAADKKYLEQFRVGDAVTLAYVLPSKSQNQDQTLFLHTRGYYEHIRDYKGIPNLMTLREFEKPGRFIRFSRDRYEQLARENNFYNLVTTHAAAR